jgi:hypothetical protein
MADQAPKSSAYVRRTLHRTDLADALIDGVAIATRRCGLGEDRAETTVERRRPAGARRNAVEEYDKLMIDTLRSLPGADGSIGIVMGREFVVYWDGVRAPI